MSIVQTLMAIICDLMHKILQRGNADYYKEIVIKDSRYDSRYDSWEVEQ
jgi:hypothetical protein